jgi:hypothetical protein
MISPTEGTRLEWREPAIGEKYVSWIEVEVGDYYDTATRTHGYSPLCPFADGRWVVTQDGAA